MMILWLPPGHRSRMHRPKCSSKTFTCTHFKRNSSEIINLYDLSLVHKFPSIGSHHFHALKQLLNFMTNFHAMQEELLLFFVPHYPLSSLRWIKLISIQGDQQFPWRTREEKNGKWGTFLFTLSWEWNKMSWSLFVVCYKRILREFTSNAFDMR